VPLVDVHNLSISFKTESGTTEATQNISFSIAKSETLALVGESGSGKSITALCLMGLLPSPLAIVQADQIEFNSEDLNKYSKSKWQEIRGNEIGMVFQEPMTSLNPLKKCGEQVTEAILLHKKISRSKAEAKTLELFHEVKLPEPEKLMHRYPHEISGGQKQRVMIAMAISCDPKLLIADEPTTALDVSVQKTILDLLKELQTKHEMAILFITHDLGLVKHFADKVMVMQNGKAVEHGQTNDIFQNAQHPYTQGLIACRPDPSKRVSYLKQVDDILEGKEFDEGIISPKQFDERIESLDKGNTILELKDLYTWYSVKKNFLGKTTQWFEALNGINLSIRKGETLGLVGESGCGKTTLGKTVIGLTDITKGDVIYNGKSLSAFDSSEWKAYRKEVQIIFQDPYSSLNPRLSIGDAIKEPMDVHGLHSAAERKDVVCDLLKKVDLEADHYKRYPHEFSGGQRQRICIARALAVEPKLIICDESVSALDVSVQAQVLNLLHGLREEFDLTYIFISHDIAVVKHISDKIAVMNQGHIVEYGTAESIYHEAQEKYTQELISNSLL